jgi:ABC-type polysaccharide/polyol phosphate export permease
MAYNYKELFWGRGIALKVENFNIAFEKLEAEYRETNPLFSINPMYNYVIMGRKIVFGTTPACSCPALQKRLKATARQVLS